MDRWCLTNVSKSFKSITRKVSPHQLIDRQNMKLLVYLIKLHSKRKDVTHSCARWSSVFSTSFIAFELTTRVKTGDSTTQATRLWLPHAARSNHALRVAVCSFNHRLTVLKVCLSQNNGVDKVQVIVFIRLFSNYRERRGYIGNSRVLLFLDGAASSSLLNNNLLPMHFQIASGCK